MNILVAVILNQFQGFDLKYKHTFMRFSASKILALAASCFFFRLACEYRLRSRITKTDMYQSVLGEGFAAL